MSLGVIVGGVFFKGKRYTLRVGDVTLSNYFPHFKQFTPKGNSLLIWGLFAFRVDLFTEWMWCAGKQTGSNRCCLPCEKGGQSSKDQGVTFGVKRMFLIC